MEPLNEFEQDLFVIRMTSMINEALVSTQLAQQGLMSEDTYSQDQNYMRSLLAWPRLRKFWSVCRSSADSDSGLIDNFDKLMQELKDMPRVTPLDLYDINNPLPKDMADARELSTS